MVSQRVWIRVRRRWKWRWKAGAAAPAGGVSGALREQLLANAVRGPSAGFAQGFDLLVVEGPDQLGRFWSAISPDRAFEARGWPGVYRAPLVVVPLADKAAYLERYAEPDKGWT